MATITIAADELARNDRVVINRDEMAYLVDRMEDAPGGNVRVTFSSGDVTEYAPSAEVVVID